MDAKSVFARALEMATNIVSAVEPHQLNSQTPCTEWDLKKLLNHMMYELAWMPELLGGKTIAEVGNTLDGDLIGAEPATAWNTLAEKVKQAVQATSAVMPVHISAGDTPAYKYIEEVAADILIHAWDVAKTIGASYVIPEDLIDWESQKMTELMQKYAHSSAFGTPIEVDEFASKQSKLLGMLGRVG